MPFQKPNLRLQKREQENSHPIVSYVPSDPSLNTESTSFAVEVVVLWGEHSVLQVDHLHPARDYFVGEPSAERAVDFVINSKALRANQVPLCEVRAADVVALIPNSATGSITIDGRSVSLEFAKQVGLLTPSSLHAHTHEFALSVGRGVRISLGDFSFIVRGVNAGKVVAGARRTDMKPLAYVGFSALLVALFLLTFYFSPPNPGSLNFDRDDSDSRLVAFMMRPESMRLDSSKSGGTPMATPVDASSVEPPGATGSLTAPKTRGRAAVFGPAENEHPQLPKFVSQEDIASTGVITTLQGIEKLFAAPSSPFASEQALGGDEQNVNAPLLGVEFVPGAGDKGTNMRGAGRGSRNDVGDNPHVDLKYNKFSGGPCETSEICDGLDPNGSGKNPRGRPGEERLKRVPDLITVRSEDFEILGGLSKEVIQRVVRQHLNEVRYCYEQQLTLRPDLQGRVNVRFVISPNGSVQSSQITQSALRNEAVERCVAQSVRRWVFPQPEMGGVVSVNYPFVFSAAGSNQID